jgi:hypothetical protein
MAFDTVALRNCRLSLRNEKVNQRQKVLECELLALWESVGRMGISGGSIVE